MERFIPYEKLSKKERRRRDARARTTWGALNPATRRPENSNAYDRRKARKWSDDSASVPFLPAQGSTAQFRARNCAGLS